MSINKSFAEAALPAAVRTPVGTAYFTPKVKVFIGWFVLTVIFSPQLFAGGCPATPYFNVWSTTYDGQTLCFVGTDPRTGPGTTTISTPIVPIKLNFLGGGVSDPTAPLLTNPKLSAVDSVIASPIFVAQDFKFGGTSVGTAQWIEATERASFWNYPGVDFDNWHIAMTTVVFPTLTLDVPEADWKVNPQNKNLIGVNTARLQNFIKDQLQTGAYYGMVPIFLVYNAYEGGGVGGHHRSVPVPALGGLQSFYIFASYYDQPYRVSDVHALSHEVAEFAHDPLHTNLISWPEKVTLPWDPPYLFTTKDCQSTLEVGDALENRTGSGLNFTTGTNGYQLANIALASWFMQAAPSFSINQSYTLNGAVDGEFPSPAPPCPMTEPYLYSIDPTSGPLAGGQVTVIGENLSTANEFDFDGMRATPLTCEKTKCTLLTPTHSPGMVRVVVKPSNSDSNNFLMFDYAPPTITTFSPAVGPTTGGLTVAITGTYLSDKMTVNFGPFLVKNPSCGGYTTNCAVISPAVMSPPIPPPVPLSITVDGITSDPTTKLFSFAVFPTFTSITPGSGGTGTPITIKGTGFSTAPGGTIITFNGVPAPPSEVSCSTLICSVRFPGATVTNVDVQVTVDGLTALKTWVFVDTDKPRPPGPM